MKRKIYLCPKCGKALNFSDNPEYTFQCFDCDEDFYSFEAKEMEQHRMEGIVDYTDLANASMEVKRIADAAIVESTRQIEIKGKNIYEQMSEYISETIKPIIQSGIYKNRRFRDAAAIYNGYLSLRFCDYIVSGKECQAQLWGQNGCLCVYFNANGKYFIEDRGYDALPHIVKAWPGFKDSMKRMIPYALKECDKENQAKLAKQMEEHDIIDNFRL